MPTTSTFTLAGALKALATPGEKHPLDAIDGLLAHWDDARPALSQVVARCAREGERASDGDWIAASTAMLMFAERRDPGGAPLLRALLRQPETFDAIYFDDGSRELVRVMISTFDGDAASLRTIAEDARADVIARDAAIETLAYHTAAGAISRDETIAWLRACGERIARDAEAWSDVTVAWAFAIGFLGATELLPDVRAHFDQGSVDDREIIEEIERLVQLSREESDPLAVFAGESIGAIDSVRAELARLDVLHEHWEKTLAEQDRLAVRAAPDDDDRPEPAINEYRDVGRNDPCPCGSGKKFKKCCLAA